MKRGIKKLIEFHFPFEGSVQVFVLLAVVFGPHLANKWWVYLVYLTAANATPRYFSYLFSTIRKLKH